MMEVRPATPADQREVCAFLQRHLDPAVTAERFGRLFSYPWMAHKPDCGFLLLDGAKLGGYIGTVYADRLVDGRMERFCNFSSWFVLPEYRKQSLRLLSAGHGDREAVYTNLSARPAVLKILEALRYRRIGRYKFFTPPLAHVWPALAGRTRGTGFITRPEEIRDQLPESARVLFDDHAGTACRHMLIEAGSRCCYIVWNRRVKQRVPFSEILHVSDNELFKRHWEQAKLRILWRDRTFALALDEHVLRCDPPRPVLRYERITMYKSPRLEPSQIDNLYTELALL